MDYEKYIRVVPNFPKEGISFKDISPILSHPEAFKACLEDLKKIAEQYHPDYIVGADSRGFLFGAPLAYLMNIGFVMVRKKGKLPGAVHSVNYDLEYGQGTLEIVDGILPKGSRVLLIDDLLATGGTFIAMKKLVEVSGSTPVAAIAVIKLEELHGDDGLGLPFHSLLTLSDSH